MADSFIRCSDDLITFGSGSENYRILPIKQNHRSLLVLMPFLLTLFAVFLAPERPQQFASICERHNPEVVCRVW